MPIGTNEVHSATGSRGYIRVGLVGVIPRYSTGAIAINNSPAAVSHNISRTWWLAEDFDYSSNPPDFFMLPCDNATFNLGDDLYKSAEDAVPGTMRVRASRCGSYSFKVAFPIIISNQDIFGQLSEISRAYTAISTAIQRANYMMAMNTSIQNRNYSCILDNFSISANGYGGINPINCQLATKGLSLASNMNIDPFRRSIITDTTRRDKESRSLGNSNGSITYAPPNIKGDAATYGGRLANIKDCAVSLNGMTYQQIVSVELNIKHTLDLASTARPEPSNIPTIRSADRIFLKNREVSGKFQFLSSYTSAMDLASLDIPNASTLSLEGGSQWASPLYIAFGPDMIFDMPAVYWQPRIEELSTGSPLITINFIARSNVRGINEFASGLLEDR